MGEAMIRKTTWETLGATGHASGACSKADHDEITGLRERTQRLQRLALAVSDDIECPVCRRLLERSEAMVTKRCCGFCGHRRIDDEFIHALNACIDSGDVPGWPR
jgi:formate dehydrogenase assembly factor FdhD